jgi:hypothetical protein
MPNVFTLLARLGMFLVLKNIACGGECCDKPMMRLAEMTREYAEIFINTLGCTCDCG